MLAITPLIRVGPLASSESRGSSPQGLRAIFRVEMALPKARVRIPALERIPQDVHGAPADVRETTSVLVGRFRFPEDRVEIGGELAQPDLVRARAPGLLEVKREGPDDFPAPVHDRRGPARAELVPAGDVAIVLPEAIGQDVLDDDHLAPKRGRSAGPEPFADGQPVDDLVVGGRKARGSSKPQP
jgi:hypothetical protein